MNEAVLGICCLSGTMMKKMNSPTVESQFDILERICARGRTLFLDKEDSLGVDMFEHLEQEIKRLRLYMEQEKIAQYVLNKHKVALRALAK